MFSWPLKCTARNKDLLGGGTHGLKVQLKLQVVHKHAETDLKCPKVCVCGQMRYGLMKLKIRGMIWLWDILFDLIWDFFYLTTEILVGRVPSGKTRSFCHSSDT